MARRHQQLKNNMNRSGAAISLAAMRRIFTALELQGVGDLFNTKFVKVKGLVPSVHPKTSFRDSAHAGGWWTCSQACNRRCA
jgi:hypothetical protein